MRFDTKRAEAFLEFLRDGLPPDNAARLAGLDPAVVAEWRKGTTSRLKRFDADVQEAMAKGEARLLNMIVQAGADNWRAAAWVLERAYPDKYGESKLPLDEPPDTPQSGMGTL